MSFNLVDLVKGQISGQVLGQISNAVGENTDATKSVIDNAIPALLGGLMDKASSNEGASALFDTIKNQDDSILDNLSGVIASKNKDSLVEGGSSMLGSLFGGDAATGLLGAVSGASGASQGSTSKIMGMVAPLAMSTVKRYMAGGGEMDKAGLTNMLMDQKDNIAGAMPSGLADQLGSSGLLSNVGNLFGGGAGAATAAVAGIAGVAGSAVAGAGDAVTGAVDGVTGKIGDVAGGVTGAVGNVADGVTGAVGSVTDGVANLAGSATDAVSGAAGKVGDLAGGAVDGVTGAVGNVADGVTGAVGNVADGVTGAVGSVTDGAANLAGSASDAVSGAAGKVGDLAGGAVDGVTGAVGDAASGVKDAAAGAVDSVGDVAEGGSSWIKKLIPIAILAALAFLALKFFGGKAPEAPDVSTSVPAVTTDMAQGGDVTGQLKGLFSSAQSSLGGITDVESAKAAIPQLTDFSGKLDGITAMADKLPDAAKPMFNSVVQGGLGQIQPMLDKAMAIPGVGAVLGKVIDPLKEKLAALGG